MPSLSNIRTTLYITRIVNGGPEEIVYSQTFLTEQNFVYPIASGNVNATKRYQVPISFTDFIATTGVPIDYRIGYYHEVYAPYDPGTGEVLDYYLASLVSSNTLEANSEPAPVFIQEKMSAPIAPVYP
jgi:hypothetical protein